MTNPAQTGPITAASVPSRVTPSAGSRTAPSIGPRTAPSIGPSGAPNTEPRTAPNTEPRTGSRSAQRRVIRAQHQDIDDKPFIVIWEVTRACQLVCKHCRADAQTRADPRQLSTAQGKALLDDIARWDTPRPLVVLTGGDPFERADLAELVAYGTAAGLSVALSPSVTPKFTAERLAELHRAGAKAVSLSLDGARPQTHDAFRGFEGTYAATRRAATTVRDEGLRLQVNTTVTRDNVHELPQLLGDVLEMGVGLWSVFFLVPTGRGEHLGALAAEEVEDVLHWLADVSSLVAIKTTEAPQYRRVVIQRAAARASNLPLPVTGPLHDQLVADTVEVLGHEIVPTRVPRPPIDVNAGRGFVFVDHTGDVYPSGFLPFRCGSVKDAGLRRIYRESPILRSLRRPEEFGGSCGRCEFRDVCGGSRSRAYAVTGDLLGADPSCVWQPGAVAPATSVAGLPATAVAGLPAVGPSAAGGPGDTIGSAPWPE
ncbi:TIGR04053 family radical SAM/SPASM domain-containing protein [Raineyella sp. LH-20]|uniref:TIGR04053 family radical SAM/SPASM domain-containing protein n=1 Tax=Raineyella sp. LH-20 TaxID=3081204 RepID=UPI002953C600|nr:TIGR04053 family radical SAM/SPASM domain-containing protein [Raineyella sp. LH-20]WOP20138.1 TIGR04053 family radical SAM/SPASM domain-containing protein [Raineyella sp. LH-20]